MTARKPEPSAYERIHVTVSTEMLEWIEANAQPGGPFGGASHAVEFALRRLRAEEEQLRQACAKSGVRFDAGALWLHYRSLLEQASVPRPGRPRKGEA